MKRIKCHTCTFKHMYQSHIETILETYLIKISMTIYPKIEPNSITKVIKKFKISQNRHVILSVVLKSGSVSTASTMRHYVIMSIQCAERCVLGLT